MIVSVQKVSRLRHGSLEEGVQMMRQKLQNQGLGAYFANENDPLHAAFLAKAALHSGTKGGKPLVGRAAQDAFENLASVKREGKSLAYIHVPFCQTRCLYCMFYQNPLEEEKSRVFTRYLIEDLKAWSNKSAQNSAPIHALYFGGGTPTALLAEDLKKILNACKTYLPLANDCEITLEGRIFNFGDDKIEAAFEGGVNRLSLGVQTFHSDIRQSVLRVDDQDSMIHRLEKMMAYDQAAVVIDLIYGFPGQTLSIWQEDLKIAASLALDGVDCYQLNVFNQSPLARYIENGQLPKAASTAEKADMFAASVDFFTHAQWQRISNNHWRNTHRERNIYNELGKSACDCLPFGSGAGGRLCGHALMMERNLDAWIDAVQNQKRPVAFLSLPEPHGVLMRTISSQMELGRIHLKNIGKTFGVPVDEILSPITNQWIKAGLFKRDGQWLIQTLAGQFWFVTMSELMLNALREHFSTVN